MDRYFWKGLAITVAVSAAMGACADARAETTIGVHAASWHSAPGYNNANPGLYVVHNGWTMGTYYNSVKRQSYYAGYTYSHQLFHPSVQLGITVGGITGYRTSPAPLIAPSIRFALGNEFGARLFYLPRVKFTGAHVLHLTFERSF